MSPPIVKAKVRILQKTTRRKKNKYDFIRHEYQHIIILYFSVMLSKSTNRVFSPA